MAIDTDLSALLPDPPLPRPARRDAAIDEALRRFDGGPPRAPASARPVAAGRGWGRPQIAALASVALVVLVSVPVWWAERDRIAPRVPPAAAPTAAAANAAPAAQPPQPLPRQSPPAAAAATPAASEAPSLATPASPIVKPGAPAPATDAPVAADARGPIEADLNRLPAFSPREVPAPPPAAAAPRAAARRAEAEADLAQSITVTGSRIQRQDHEATTPIVTVSEGVLEAGLDWNACTLHDPRRDLDACRALADPGVRGAKGRAGAQLADGLVLAWQGDLDRAIAAFDRAIDAAPDLSIAYLNRGLAYQKKGDLRRALADLNRAVARDPGDGRAYYHRGQLQRARGDARRADADARRAAELGHD